MTLTNDCFSVSVSISCPKNWSTKRFLFEKLDMFVSEGRFDKIIKKMGCSSLNEMKIW